MHNIYIYIYTPCYTARKDSVADPEEDSNSQEPPSPSGSDFRNPIQQESEYDHQLLVLTKEFVPDMDMLEKEFNSEQNRVKREAYRANHTKEQKIEVLEKWKSFMREVKTDYPFFEYFEKHFHWQKRNFVKTKLPSKDILPKRVRHPTHKVEKPVSPSPKVNVLEAYLSSSSSNEPSSDKEIDPLEDYIPLTQLSLSNLLPLSLPEQEELLISRNLLSSMSLILSHTWPI